MIFCTASLTGDVNQNSCHVISLSRDRLEKTHLKEYSVIYSEDGGAQQTCPPKTIFELKSDIILQFYYSLLHCDNLVL